jgi:hypothetical protein
MALADPGTLKYSRLTVAARNVMTATATDTARRPRHPEVRREMPRRLTQFLSAGAARM